MFYIFLSNLCMICCYKMSETENKHATSIIGKQKNYIIKESKLFTKRKESIGRWKKEVIKP